MAFLSLWLKKIILLVLLATFVDLLLPNGSLQKYVKMVMGLLLLLTFLSPVFLLIKGDSNIDRVLTDLLKGSDQKEMVGKEQILTDAEKLKESQKLLAIEQAKQEIANQVEQNIEKNYDFDVESINVGIKESGAEYVDLQLVHLEVVLREREEDGRNVALSDQGIKPVTIEPVTPVMQQQQKAADGKLKRMTEMEEWLRQQWSLEKDQVRIVVKEKAV